MSARPLGALFEPLLIRIIAQQPTPAERLAFARLAHEAGAISDAALCVFAEAAKEAA